MPEEIRKLKPEERMPYIKKKAEARAAMQKEIGDLTGKRDAFLARLSEEESLGCRASVRRRGPRHVARTSGNEGADHSMNATAGCHFDPGGRG